MRWIQILFLTLFSSLLVVGCLNSDNPIPVGEEGETIHLLGIVGVHEAIVNSLEKALADSHIKVDKNFYYWSTFLAKARMAIMNDTREYDVILGPCSQFTSFINNNKMVSLEDTAQRAGLKTQDLYPEVRKSVIVDNKFCCLPYLADSLIYIYRTDLFRKNGLTPPHTINEMYGIGKKLTSGNEYGLAFPAGPGEGATPVWSYFLWSYGGDYFDSDWHPLINSTQSLYATRTYNQILQDCAPLEVATWQTEEATNFFMAGHLASMILWSGASNILSDKNRCKIAGKIGYAPLPIGNGNKSVPSMEIWGVMVPRSSQHIIAAKRFCELLISRETFEAVANLRIAPTPSPSINLHYASESPNSSFAVATQSLAISREKPNIPEAIQFIPVIGAALNDILMGAEPKETLNATNQQIEDIMQLSGRLKRKR
jgi:ABC-type glycerol-3-phosphate transport system substrate-binding protein